MKKSWRKISICLLIMILVCIILPLELMAETQREALKQVDIVFTHDLHSHLEPFLMQTEEGKEVLGGFARIKTLIDSKREEAGELLVLDAGDFSMGTLYQSIFETDATELTLLGQMEYDVTTLGNHEFDYTLEGLINMLQSALAKKAILPSMVLCNIDWEKSLQGEYAKVNEAFFSVWKQYGVQPYVMLKKNGVNIAVIGVFGKSSLEYSPTCTLSFKDPVEAVKETVEVIKSKEEADMIVCISHSGTNANIKKSEDEILAMEVPELDLIVSGHTHTLLEEPIVHGNTAIVSCGEYGRYMGNLSMIEVEEGIWQVENYELIKVDSDVAQDLEISAQIQAFSEEIDAKYLSQFGYTRDQVLCYNPWKYQTLKQMSADVQEQPFANLLADSYLFTLEKLGINSKDETMISVVPMGVIRDVLPENQEITVTNVYDVLSLGRGNDGVSGYPLICMYLTGKEIKVAAEIDASISKLMSGAQLFISGISYEINPNRLILNRVTDVQIMDFEGNTSEIEDDTLYPVVMDLYSGRMIGSVTNLSYGLISIKPKNANGEPISDLGELIITYNGKEIKAWTAVANYLESFSEEGIIPQKYSRIQGRKSIVDDDSLGAILRKPNALIVKIGAIILGILVSLVILIVIIIKSIKKYNLWL